MNHNPHWKDKTCEKCEFLQETVCRRFPPNRQEEFRRSLFPYVTSLSYACAEYKEAIEESMSNIVDNYKVDKISNKDVL